MIYKPLYKKTHRLKIDDQQINPLSSANVRVGNLFSSLFPIKNCSLKQLELDLKTRINLETLLTY